MEQVPAAPVRKRVAPVLVTDLQPGVPSGLIEGLGRAAERVCMVAEAIETRERSRSASRPASRGHSSSSRPARPKAPGNAGVGKPSGAQAHAAEGDGGPRGHGELAAGEAAIAQRPVRLKVQQGLQCIFCHVESKDTPDECWRGLTCAKCGKLVQRQMFHKLQTRKGKAVGEERARLISQLALLSRAERGCAGLPTSGL